MLVGCCSMANRSSVTGSELLIGESVKCPTEHAMSKPSTHDCQDRQTDDDVSTPKNDGSKNREQVSGAKGARKAKLVALDEIKGWSLGFDQHNQLEPDLPRSICASGTDPSLGCRDVLMGPAQC